MSSKKANMVLVLVLLLIVLPALSIGGRELADEKDHNKQHSTAASEKGATASEDMVKTNDYGRYDPSPAFSKPRFKLIPN
ncbi:hypothetical protein BDA96_05G118000 [Sorghum bicolor]|uniref:Uncharacterized protein n=3 Tax=Sorghum bicolor TaxID=4558 RepID=A0A921QY01_SORBI|nr:uncharacterized protein LOC8155466 isoform X1 [Sorghum bicolor]KAG0529669.1 hypothetical protein BDA96_05G118000 [Sorghum bicolor]OQU83365.1 hypothetical protein SORBI_3005G110469 [Sorghum bicolor]|eukprot:XP_002489332.2 uncharacterized protein LOC8155466 isoform X1 [Sorghum bicolor]